jgi:hypothetical protein
MRSRSAITAALGATLALTLTACNPVGGATADGGASTQPTATPSPTPDPADLLAAAVARTTGVSLKVKLAGDTSADDLTGTYDAVHKIGKISQASDLQVLVSGDDMYLSGSSMEGITLHVKVAKLPPKNPVGLFTDVLAPLDLLPATTSVEASGPHKFDGHLDLGKVQAATAGAKKFLDFVTTAAGTRANYVSFIAKTDDAGYLVEFDAVIPGLGGSQDGAFDVTYSDIGKPETNKVPTGPSVIDAPASFYAAT